MRITNGIINNNTKSNVILNKEYADKYNTMVATGQKITRPSDDPIIAIRALRLNNNISEINQYHGKNIPDAEAWIEITETALKQTEGVLSSVQEYLTQGASDDNTAEDRKNILENLKGLRDQIYSSGNADYAGRTVFTGYRTGESLTFTNDEKQKFTIVQNFTNEDFETFTYIEGSYDYDPANLAAYDQTTYDQTKVQDTPVYRIRLAYDNLMAEDDGNGGITQTGVDANNSLDNTFSVIDKNGTAYPNPAVSISYETLKGKTQQEIDQIYTGVGDDEVKLIADTGELILGKNIADKMRLEGSTASIEYAKEEWQKNDPRPEHYFACKTLNTDKPGNPPILYNYDDAGNADFQDRKIQYEIAYNQKIEININADEVYTPYITRDVDELLEVTQSCQDAYEKMKKFEAAKKSDDYKDPTNKEKIDLLYDAAQKEYDLYKEKMQKAFSHSITIFKGYTNDLNNKISALGSLSNRLDLTKSRVSDQLENFKELADSNINVELTESAIDLKNAETALQAAQAAAAKVAKTSLLDYL